MLFFAMKAVFFICAMRHALSSNQSTAPLIQPYGVDISFPIHYSTVSTNYDWLPHNIDPQIPTPSEYTNMPIQPLGDRSKFYTDFMNGCRENAKDQAHRCDENEADRFESNLLQPMYMVNFTENGYKKIRAPETLFRIIQEFWEKNKHNEILEAWSAGETTTNHWVNASTMVNIGESIHEGGGAELYDAIAEAARISIQEWTGLDLISTSVYGIRVYKEGSLLAPHVDRLPLISSAIINVDQDVDEPWPLEVIGHDGRAENVTMLPGDLVLYESHSVIHGRPYPLKGRFFANIFIHFKPRITRENSTIPKYIVPDNAAAEKWYLDKGKDDINMPTEEDSEVPDENNFQDEIIYQEDGINEGRNMAHYAAIEGDLSALQTMLKETSGTELFNYEDENGWTPLHEAVRSLNLEMVQFMIEHGADVNARTPEDSTTLDLATYYGGNDHPLVTFLRPILESVEVDVDEADLEL